MKLLKHANGPCLGDLAPVDIVWALGYYFSETWTDIVSVLSFLIVKLSKCLKTQQ